MSDDADGATGTDTTTDTGQTETNTNDQGAAADTDQGGAGLLGGAFNDDGAGAGTGGGDAGGAENGDTGAESEGGEGDGAAEGADDAPETLKVPGKDATDEERATFEKAAKAALGVPEKADGYQLPSDIGKEQAEAIRNDAHELGLSQSQVDALIRKQQDQAAAHKALVDQQMQQGMAELQKQWGGKFQENGKLAERALTRFASPDMVKQFKAGGWDRNPEMIKFLYEVGSFLGEDRLESVTNMNGKNPWSKDNVNVTEQGRLIKTNPALAKSLAAQAGVKLDLD